MTRVDLQSIAFKIGFGVGKDTGVCLERNDVGFPHDLDGAHRYQAYCRAALDDPVTGTQDGFRDLAVLAFVITVRNGRHDGRVVGNSVHEDGKAVDFRQVAVTHGIKGYELCHLVKGFEQVRAGSGDLVPAHSSCRCGGQLDRLRMDR